MASANAQAVFLKVYQTRYALVAGDETTMVLEVGKDHWPLPIPFVKVEGKWYVDGAKGAEEINYRTIGRYELGAIAVCRGFVEAQVEYAAKGCDGNEAGLFAARLMSDPGQRNGLYCPVAEGEPESPLGEAVASAAAECYKCHRHRSAGLTFIGCCTHRARARRGALSIISKTDC